MALHSHETSVLIVKYLYYIVDYEFKQRELNLASKHAFLNYIFLNFFLQIKNEDPPSGPITAVGFADSQNFGNNCSPLPVRMLPNIP